MITVSTVKDRSTPGAVVVLSVLVPAGLCILLLIGLHQVPASVLLEPLETRFPIWRQDPAKRVDGIIFLGGFHLEYSAGEWAGIPSVTAERIIAAVRLSKLYPEARILYSGGGSEARLGKEILVGLGVPFEKIGIEDKSRSTSENAKFSRIIAAPKRSETWLLVTSAYHMPRAMGVFRAAGFPVEAYPVEFIGTKADKNRSEYVAKALGEYIALIVYWLSSQSDELFPSPSPAASSTQSCEISPYWTYSCWTARCWRSMAIRLSSAAITPCGMACSSRKICFGIPVWVLACFVRYAQGRPIISSKPPLVSWMLWHRHSCARAWDYMHWRAGDP